MHEISDGERRRVQLVMGLMAPWDILLLDEVTVDLDVLVRGDLIDFLIEESKTRKATIVYCQSASPLSSCLAALLIHRSVLVSRHSHLRRESRSLPCLIFVRTD